MKSSRQQNVRSRTIPRKAAASSATSVCAHSPAFSSHLPAQLAPPTPPRAPPRRQPRSSAGLPTISWPRFDKRLWAAGFAARHARKAWSTPRMPRRGSRSGGDGVAFCLVRNPPSRGLFMKSASEGWRCRTIMEISARGICWKDCGLWETRSATLKRKCGRSFGANGANGCTAEPCQSRWWIAELSAHTDSLRGVLGNPNLRGPDPFGLHFWKPAAALAEDGKGRMPNVGAQGLARSMQDGSADEMASEYLRPQGAS